VDATLAIALVGAVTCILQREWKRRESNRARPLAARSEDRETSETCVQGVHFHFYGAAPQEGGKRLREGLQHLEQLHRRHRLQQRLDQAATSKTLGNGHTPDRARRAELGDIERLSATGLITRFAFRRKYEGAPPPSRKSFRLPSGDAAQHSGLTAVITPGEEAYGRRRERNDEQSHEPLDGVVRGGILVRVLAAVGDGCPGERQMDEQEDRGGNGEEDGSAAPSKTPQPDEQHERIDDEGQGDSVQYPGDRRADEACENERQEAGAARRCSPQPSVAASTDRSFCRYSDLDR
jgi:hypothetical protein